MIGGVCDFDRMVCFFLGMVGARRFSSSFRSSSSSISSMVESSILVLDSLFQVAITRVVFYFSSIVTSFFSFASCFLLRPYLIVLGSVIERVLVVSLVVVPGILRFW